MSPNDRDYSEKRDYIRMRVDAEVTLIHQGQVIPAVCIDLSSSGMQVQAPRSFKVGDQLSVRIDSEHAALRDWKRTPKWSGSPSWKATARNLALQS